MITRVKDVILTIGSGTTPKSGEEKYYNNGTIPWLNSGDLNDDVVYSCAKYINKIALSDYSALHFYPKDSVVVAMYGASIGNTGILNFETTVNQACCVLVPNEKLISPFYLQLLLKLSKNKFLLESFGGTQPNISQKIVANLLIDVPPLAEQEAIAAYLDKECGLIGKKVDLLEQKADRYRRLRRAIINQAVTRGLNPDVELFNAEGSLVEQYPCHWSELRIKDLFTEKSIKGHADEPMLCATQLYGVIPQSMYENRVVVAVSGLENMKLVEKGNFVISLRSFQGGIEIAHYRGIISAAYTILELKEIYDKGYFKHLLKSASLIKLLKKCVTGIREGQNINYTVFKYEKLPIPPVLEQQEIAAYLDEKCGKIDEIVSKIELEISKLKELKRSLINEVVTGQHPINN
jgi:type I restriction enzyme S subunit